jgi:hypothetical protein
MNWNEFFKQDRRKNIITVIFLVLSFIISLISSTYSDICNHISFWLCPVIILFSIPFRLEGAGAYVIIFSLFLFYFVFNSLGLR